jgi:hypothetical protein
MARHESGCNLSWKTISFREEIPHQLASLINASSFLLLFFFFFFEDEHKKKEKVKKKGEKREKKGREKKKKKKREREREKKRRSDYHAQSSSSGCSLIISGRVPFRATIWRFMLFISTFFSISCEWRF